MRAIASQSNHPIEKELLEATGFMPEKRYRKREEYLAALLRAACDLPDSDFEKLSDEAAEWAYQASDAYQIKEPIPDFLVQSPVNGSAHGHDAAQSEDLETAPDPQTVESMLHTQQHEDAAYEDLSEEAVTSSDQIAAVEVQEVEEKPKAKRGRKSGTKVAKKAKEPKEVKVKAKEPKEPKPPRPNALQPTNGPYEVARGTVSEMVCNLMAREQGTTMREIMEVTGHYRYNVVNRLRRLGWHITKDGTTLKLRGRVADQQ